MKRIFTLLLVVLLVCGLVVACGGEKENPEPNGDIIDEQQTNAAPETTSTKATKTFENVVDQEDYTIEYPNNWEVEDVDDEITLKPMDDDIYLTQIKIYREYQPGLSSNDIDALIEETKKIMEEQQGEDELYFEFDKIKFNDYDTMKMSMEMMGINIETYNIPMNDVLMILAVNFEESTEAEVRDILKTFRLK